MKFPAEENEEIVETSCEIQNGFRSPSQQSMISL
jgi:hypothetical protein